jgi:uncharacterized protein YbbC (DUF1343 family)
MKKSLALAALALLAGCAGPRVESPVAPRAAARGVSPRVLSGLDVLERENFETLRGKRIGLITNHTGRDAAGRSTVEVLGRAEGVTLAAIFSPEHGFAGAVEDENIAASSFTLDGRAIPIISLYSGGIQGMRPKQDDLEGLDALVFDIQDIGARFYTYLATMGMAMEEAAKANLEFVVLDRPNPINGVTMEGPLLDDLSLRKITSTAYFAVPVRHGMTAGEIARMHNAEIHGRLSIVPLRGWKREMWYDETGLPWIPPSPNMPDLEAATMYPGIAVFEASNLAVGRGTPWPFRWIGAPWLDADRVTRELNASLLDGVTFSVQDYTPTKSVFKGEKCRGVRMTITDRDHVRPLAVFLKLQESIRRAHPKEFVWQWSGLHHMTGTLEFQRLLESGGDPLQLQQLFEQGPERFEKIRAPFLLY